LGYRLITKFAERIADHAVLIAKELIDSKRPVNLDIVKRITTMSNFALAVLDEACLSMFKQDYNSADKAIEKAREIDYLEKSIMNGSNLRNMNDIYRIKIITENLRRVAEYSSDIAEIVLNMTVQQTLKKG
jgi:phosphate uptake regulator